MLLQRVTFRPGFMMHKDDTRRAFSNALSSKCGGVRLGRFVASSRSGGGVPPNAGLTVHGHAARGSGLAGLARSPRSGAGAEGRGCMPAGTVI